MGLLPAVHPLVFHSLPQINEVNKHTQWYKDDVQQEEEQDVEYAGFVEHVLDTIRIVDCTVASCVACRRYSVDALTLVGSVAKHSVRGGDSARQRSIGIVANLLELVGVRNG